VVKALEKLNGFNVAQLLAIMCVCVSALRWREPKQSPGRALNGPHAPEGTLGTS